jgi:hypothetical protein
MKIKKQIIIPKKKNEKVVELICDICKKNIIVVNAGLDNNNWATNEYENNMQKVTIKLEDGNDCLGSGGESTETEFDVCPECFKEKIMPFIESFGSKPQVTEHDW